jgi:hypothetical protein
MAVRTYFQSLIRIVKYNFRICFRLSTVLAIVLCALSQGLFDFNSMTTLTVADMGEIYLSVIGILLFTQLGRLEERNNVNEIAYLKRIPHIRIFVLRLVMAFMISFVCIFAVISIAKIRNGSFDFWKITVGVWISTVYFGMLGLTLVNMTGELAAGYIGAFGYYVFELFTRGSYTGDFYVFSLLNNSFDEKYKILIVIIVVMIGNLVLVKKKS